MYWSLTLTGGLPKQSIPQPAAQRLGQPHSGIQPRPAWFQVYLLLKAKIISCEIQMLSCSFCYLLL